MSFTNCLYSKSTWQAGAFVWLYMCCDNIWDVHRGTNCNCKSSIKSVAWHMLNSGFLLIIHNYYNITIQVTNVRQQEKLKYPPHPLSTIELEKRASRYFRMSSEHTMKVSICWELCYVIVYVLYWWVMYFSSLQLHSRWFILLIVD